MLKVLCFSTLFLTVPVWMQGGARADDASDARRHAQRASALAASGKCKQAVAEFDKALAILRDPALLFNRGECHRKLGDSEAALDDYRQFLSDLPKAPNRATVEKRIAELSGKPSGAAASPAAAPSAVAARAPAARVAPESAGSPVTGGAAASSRPGSSDTAREVPAPARSTPGPREIILAPAPPSPASESSPSTEAPGAVIAVPEEKAETAVPSSSSSDSGITSRPWFWVAVGVVAVGAGVGTFLMLNRDGTKVPSSALGNYKF